MHEPISIIEKVVPLSLRIFDLKMYYKISTFALPPISRLRQTFDCYAKKVKCSERFFFLD